MTIWFLLLESLVRGFFAELNRLVGDLGILVVDLWRAFPNLAKMADVLARWATSLLGRLFAAPITGVAEMLIARLEKERLHNRLIRLDDALRMFARGHEEAIQAITLTDESGIVGLLAGYVAGAVYRFVKRWALLAKLIAAESEAEFVRLIVTSIQRKAYLYFWVAVIVAMIGVLVVGSVWISFTCLCLVFIKGLENKYILPQDSKRQWRKRGGVARVNARRGPDLVPK